MQDPRNQLSRRERQIMDAIYELGEASAAEVLDRLPDPPSYSAVRAMLAKLEKKGQLRHDQQGKRYLFKATTPREEVRDSALSRLVKTFFDGSAASAVTSLLGRSAREMSPEELDQIAAMIESARQREQRG